MNDHLKANRALVVGRSLVAGAVGMLPVPYLDDLLAGAVRGGLLRRVAELRRVDVDANAISQLATPQASRLLQAAGLGSVALGGTRRFWRRLAAPLIVMRRVDEAMQTYQVGTLFDHYCAVHHIGFGLDGERAAEVRRAIDAAVRAARDERIERTFRKILRAPGAMFLMLPRALSRWRRRKEPVTAEPLDERVRLVESSGFVRRAVGRVAAVEDGYVRALCDAFDAVWAPPK